MAAKQLPERPNLEQLKRQAKELLHAARANGPGALAAFPALPAFAHALRRRARRQTARAPRRPVGDRPRVRIRLLERASRARRGADARLRRRRGSSSRPRPTAEWIAPSGCSRCIRGSRRELPRGAAARRRAQSSAQLAATRRAHAERGGPRGWEPLHYVCYTAVGARSAARAGLVAIARRLIALGADPDALPVAASRRATARALGRRVRRPVAAARGSAARSGRRSDDGVTLPLAAAAGNVAALELLLAHGADVNQPWATDGAAPLYAILTGARRPWRALAARARRRSRSGVRRERRDAAARRRGELGRRDRRAAREPWRRRHAPRERRPHAVRGGGAERQPGRRGLAAGARRASSFRRGSARRRLQPRRRGGGALLAARPELRGEIGPEHYTAMHQAAERDDTRALEVMLDCGFDPNRRDERIGKTALHSAAMAGWPDAVGLLLAHGASVRCAIANSTRRRSCGPQRYRVRAAGKGPRSRRAPAARCGIASGVAAGARARRGDLRDRQRVEGSRSRQRGPVKGRQRGSVASSQAVAGHSGRTVRTQRCQRSTFFGRGSDERHGRVEHDGNDPPPNDVERQRFHEPHGDQHCGNAADGQPDRRRSDIAPGANEPHCRQDTRECTRSHHDWKRCAGVHPEQAEKDQEHVRRRY